MSDNEALMWNLEKDPAMSSWFASVTMLDRAPDIARFRLRIAKAVHDIPRLRQRVKAGIGRLSPPRWVDDDQFDLEYHVRRMAVPSPGTDRELYDLCTHLLIDPFERTRPLWQFVLIEGLTEGRAALFQKMHHTITDGEGGVRLSEKFIELTRDAPDPEPPPEYEPPDVPDDLVTDLTTTVSHNVRRFAGIGQRALTGIVTDPAGAYRNVSGVADVLGEMLGSEGADGQQIGSPRWTSRSLLRWYGTIRVPFDEAKSASKALGGTLNDFFVAGALTGASLAHGDDAPDLFRVAMPVSTRTDASAGGNAFSISTNNLRATTDPVEAFAVVNEATGIVKGGGAVDVLGSLSMIVNLLPTSVIARFAREQAGKIDFTVSNVRGAPFELFTAGARIDATYPMGPIAGTAFNLTLLSYNGSLHMGLVVDAGAIDDPPAVRDAIEDAFEKLCTEG